MKRRLHALLIKYDHDPMSGVRMPYIGYKEHDRFDDPYVFHTWDDKKLYIFKNAVSLKADLNARVLRQTKSLRIDLKPVMDRVRAIRDLKRRGNDLLADKAGVPPQACGGSESEPTEESAWDGIPQFYVDLWGKHHSPAADMNGPDVPNEIPDPFTGAPLPRCDDKCHRPLTPEASLVLQALTAPLQEDIQLERTTLPFSGEQRDVLMKLDAIRKVKAPALKEAMAKNPCRSQQSVFLCFQGGKAIRQPSRYTFVPDVDMNVGDVAVVYMLPMKGEEWLGKIKFAIVRVDYGPLEELPTSRFGVDPATRKPHTVLPGHFMGTFMEPAAQKKHNIYPPSSVA
jgi:hypothetical protein